MSLLYGSSTLTRIVWPVALAMVLPASFVASRIREVTFDKFPDSIPSTIPMVKTSHKSGFGALCLRVIALGSIFIMVDECAGFDVLYRAFGIDLLPKTQLQKLLRNHRDVWGKAKASGSPSRLRETFFQLKRERFEIMGLKYQEEPMKTPWDTGRPSELLDPVEVRVFFILYTGSRNMVSKIYLAFNVDLCQSGIRERVERTTKWILTRQVESKLVGGTLEMPCKLERAYRDRSEGEHLLQWARNEDGSHTLADAWDQKRTYYV